jgi:capsular polysaccharide biosynthesis protein/MinD-like ATPase involved in chromosome partitioning or flagellar assembly
MNQTPRPLSHYLHVLKRQGWLVLFVTALAILAAYASISTQSSVYRASMKIVVGQAGGQFQPILGSQPLTLTMTNLFESEIVARDVITNLGLPVTTEELLKNTHVKVRPDSSVLNVTYDASSRSAAVRVLNEFAKVYTKLVDERLRGGGNKQRGGPFALIVARIFDPPHALPERVSPKPKKTLTFATALGLAMGLILAAARESLDDRIRTRKDAEEVLGAPVIGTLPKSDRRLPTLGGSPNSRNAAMRQDAQMLAASVQFSAAGVTGPVILITSALAEEGKSTVAANLSVALALAGNDVVCVDADLRRPKLHEYLGLPDGGEGLAQVLGTDVDAERALQQVPISSNGRERAHTEMSISLKDGAPDKEPDAIGRLRVLTAGRTQAGAAPPMTRDSASALFERLSATAAYVIIDAPPLLQMGDAFLLALSANSVLIVSRRGRSTKQRAEAVRATLEGLGVRRTAVVLTDVASSDGSYGYG